MIPPLASSMNKVSITCSHISTVRKVLPLLKTLQRLLALLPNKSQAIRSKHQCCRKFLSLSKTLAFDDVDDAFRSLVWITSLLAMRTSILFIQRSDERLIVIERRFRECRVIRMEKRRSEEARLNGHRSNTEGFDLLSEGFGGA